MASNYVNVLYDDEDGNPSVEDYVALWRIFSVITTGSSTGSTESIFVALEKVLMNKEVYY